MKATYPSNFLSYFHNIFTCIGILRHLYCQTKWSIPEWNSIYIADKSNIARNQGVNHFKLIHNQDEQNEVFYAELKQTLEMEQDAINSKLHFITYDYAQIWYLPWVQINCKLKHLYLAY